MTKDAAIKAMSDSFDYGTALLNEQSDQTMMQTVMPKFIGPSSRARVYTFLIGHTWDIYGQMVVYLRLSGVPPASQRPKYGQAYMSGSSRFSGPFGEGP